MSSSVGPVAALVGETKAAANAAKTIDNVRSISSLHGTRSLLKHWCLRLVSVKHGFDDRPLAQYRTLRETLASCGSDRRSRLGPRSGRRKYPSDGACRQPDRGGANEAIHQASSPMPRGKRGP